jgi:hypothetical protein
MFTIGVFQDTTWAARGIEALVNDGFPPESLSVIARQSPEVEELVRGRFADVGSAVEIHRLGPSVARGPLVDALQGTDSGLRSTGLARSIGRAGFQAHDGFIYEALVGRGGVLVAVHSVPRASDALARLHAYGGGNAAIGAWAGRV